MDLEKVLETIDRALGVVKTVADTPGVNLIPYVSTVSSAIGAVHVAYTAGKNITPYIKAISDTFASSKPPTEDQLADLDAKIFALESAIDAPLPPKEEGEDA